jgi:hypothetical protein
VERRHHLDRVHREDRRRPGPHAAQSVAGRGRICPEAERQVDRRGGTQRVAGQRRRSRIAGPGRDVPQVRAVGQTAEDQLRRRGRQDGGLAFGAVPATQLGQALRRPQRDDPAPAALAHQSRQAGEGSDVGHLVERQQQRPFQPAALLLGQL